MREKHKWTFEDIGRMTIAQMIAAIREKPEGRGVTCSISDARKRMSQLDDRRTVWIDQQMEAVYD